MQTVRQLFAAGRDLTRHREPKFTHAGLAAFLGAPKLPSGIHSIITHETYIDFLWTDRARPTTVVTFHPALKRTNGMPLPVFGGKQIAGDNSNHLAVADPSLYRAEPVNLAWYAGATNFPLQALLPAILRKFLGGTRNIVFFGASGGGFAALYYAHEFPGSLTIAINPQTKISRYVPQSVETYLCFCHNVKNITDIKQCGITEDLTDKYKHGHRNHVLYCQNTEDSHTLLHMQPFMEATGKASGSGRIAVHMQNWGEGHSAPARTELKSLVQQAVDSGGRWQLYLDRFTGTAAYLSSRGETTS